jgi:hypothetical protein
VALCRKNGKTEVVRVEGDLVVFLVAVPILIFLCGCGQISIGWQWKRRRRRNMLTELLGEVFAVQIVGAFLPVLEGGGKFPSPHLC